MNPPPLRIVDSITELKPGLDAGCLAVSGSHGGMSSARYALAARPLLSVFNDAGVGLDDAGIKALPWLQEHELAACAVAHTSARIGEAACETARSVGYVGAGTVEFTDVVSVQTTALSNERTRLTLQGSRLIASVQLIAALGGGWQGLPVEE